MSDSNYEFPSTIAKDITVSFISKLTTLGLSDSDNASAQICKFYDAVYKQVVDSEKSHK